MRAKARAGFKEKKGGVWKWAKPSGHRGQGEWAAAHSAGGKHVATATERAEHGDGAVAGGRQANKTESRSGMAGKSKWRIKGLGNQGPAAGGGAQAPEAEGRKAGARPKADLESQRRGQRRGGKRENQKDRTEVTTGEGGSQRPLDRGARTLCRETAEQEARAHC